VLSEVLAAIKAAEQKILSSGISLGGVAASAAVAKEKVQRGYGLLVLGWEVKLLVDCAPDLLGAIRE
jgi:2-keto-3-deoxy-L-rhamnonate aldolase RhmA